MRIAIAQMSSVPGDLASTTARMLEVADASARKGCDLVVYPASVLSGLYPAGVCASVSYTLDMLRAIEEFASRTPVLAAVPAYLDDGERPYYEVFICSESTACPSRQRFSRGSGAEAPSAADIDASWTVDGVDIRFIVGDTGIVAHDADCDVLMMVSPIPFCDMDATGAGAAGLGDSSLAGMVQESPCWVGVVQGVGAYDDAVLAGGSFAADPDGRLVAVCSNFEDDLAVFDVCPMRDYASRPLDESEPFRAPAPGVAVGRVAELDRDQRTGLLWRALSVAVRDYVRKSGFSDAVVGLSGGIDSAVVAALAADGLGPEHVLGVLMPGPYSSEGSVTDSLELARRLGIRTKTVPISGLFETCCPLFDEVLDVPFAGLARENLQARLRGTVLMTISNATGALVLATGNKSEAGMGYSTLYGDTVGAYSPMCDIYKGRVYELARWRNGAGPAPVIPDEIIDKPPSAELSEDQTDEGSFGATYDEIDRILYMHVERGLGAADIVAAGCRPEAVEHVLDACRKAEYKRRQEPFGPIVSLMPFVDRGWPVVFGWRDKVPSGGDAGLPATVPDDEGCLWCQGADAARPDDAELLAADPSLRVSAAIESMLVRSMQQDQIVGMVTDIAFSSFVSGRGPEMDGVMGIPMFSKN